MNEPTAGARENFRDAFCRKFNCPSASFERRVFWRCLYPQAWPVAWLILGLRPQFFDNDFQTIRQLGILRSREEVRAELDALAYRNRQGGGTLRNLYRVRVSGRKLMRLFDHVFGREQE